MIKFSWNHFQINEQHNIGAVLNQSHCWTEQQSKLMLQLQGNESVLLMGRHSVFQGAKQQNQNNPKCDTLLT